MIGVLLVLCLMLFAVSGVLTLIRFDRAAHNTLLIALLILIAGCVYFIVAYVLEVM